MMNRPGANPSEVVMLHQRMRLKPVRRGAMSKADRQLRRAGIVASLILWCAMSHAQEAGSPVAGADGSCSWSDVWQKIKSKLPPVPDGAVTVAAERRKGDIKVPRSRVKHVLDGVWLIEAVVDEKGGVLDVRILDTPRIEPPWPEYEASTARDVRGFKFSPARVNGEARPSCVTIRARESGTPRIQWLPGTREEYKPEFAEVVQVSEHDVVLPPVVITSVGFRYPPELKAKRTTGQAVVKVIIARDGTMSEPRVVEATHPEFGEAAVAALSQWTFRPATINGSPVAVYYTLTAKFERK
jgi:TonB family protein